MTKLYTGTGDLGRTKLLDGTGAGKDDPRIEAYGTVDETNVAVGSARVEILELSWGEDRAPFIVETLDDIQDGLMRLASQLATADGSGIGVEDRDVAYIEDRIDRAQDMASEIRHFLIPGVSRAEASLHTARAVCRRAERRVVALASSHTVPSVAIRYLNRLSDLLFALSRVCIEKQGLAERIWRQQ